MDARLSGKRVLVTGGLGYIGKHVVKAFLEAGAGYVEIWDIKKGFTKDGSNLGWAHVHGVLGRTGYLNIDITEHVKLLDYYAEHEHFDIVINLAALADVPSCEANPDRAMKVNVDGMKKVMSLANVWGALFIQADSAMSPFANSSMYAKSKWIAKELVSANRTEGFSSICLTMYNVAGAHPNREIGEDHDPETHLIPNAINAVLTNKVFKLDSNADVIKRDFIHVCDVASAFVRAALRYADGCLALKDYEVGFGRALSIKNVLAMVIEHNWTSNELKWELVETGRWEPYKNGVISFAANRDNRLPDWEPKYTVSDMIYHQFKFAEERLPVTTD